MRVVPEKCPELEFGVLPSARRALDINSKQAPSVVKFHFSPVKETELPQQTKTHAFEPGRKTSIDL